MWRAKHWLCRGYEARGRKTVGGGRAGGRWMLPPSSAACSAPRRFPLQQLSQDRLSLLLLPQPRPIAFLPSSCHHLHVPAAASSPHSESVSTIDAALSSLPHLTSSLREFLFPNFVLEHRHTSAEPSTEILLDDVLSKSFEALTKDRCLVELEGSLGDELLDIDSRNFEERSRCDSSETIPVPASPPKRGKHKIFHSRMQNKGFSPEPVCSASVNGPRDIGMRQQKIVGNHFQLGISNSKGLECRKAEVGQTKNDSNTELQNAGSSGLVASDRMQQLKSSSKQVGYKTEGQGKEFHQAFVQNAGKSGLVVGNVVKQPDMGYKNWKGFDCASVQNAVKAYHKEKNDTNVEIAEKDEGMIKGKEILADSGHIAHSQDAWKVDRSNTENTYHQAINGNQPGVLQRVAEFDSNIFDHRKINKKQRSKWLWSRDTVEHKASCREEWPDLDSKQMSSKRFNIEKQGAFPCDVVKSVKKAEPDIIGRMDQSVLSLSNFGSKTPEESSQTDGSMEVVNEYENMRENKNSSKSPDSPHNSPSRAFHWKKRKKSEHQLAPDGTCATDRAVAFDSQKRDNPKVSRRRRNKQFWIKDNDNRGVSVREEESNQKLEQLSLRDNTELEINDRMNQSLLPLETCGPLTLEKNQETLKIDDSRKAIMENTVPLTLRKRQEQLETEASKQASQEYREKITNMCKKQLTPHLPFVKSLLLSWFDPLRDAILAEQRAIANNEFSRDRSNYGPYLLQLGADVLAVVTMHRLMGLMIKEHDHGSIRLVRAATSVGEAVEQEIEIHRIVKKRKKNSKLTQRSQASSEPEAQDNETAHLEKGIQAMFKHRRSRVLDMLLKKARISKPWDSGTQAKVGARLIELMTEVAYVHPPLSQMDGGATDVRQALRHSFKRYEGNTKRQSHIFGVISCDPVVWKSFEKAVYCSSEIPYMPMLVKPRDWTSYYQGGYLILRANLMRTHGAESQKMAITESSKGDLKHVFEALNSLGSTAWRINTRILDVVDRIWEEGGRLAGLVDRDNLPVPPKPETNDEEVLRTWRKEAYKPTHINSQRYSLRCDIELKLSVARKFRNEERFFYPHNLDFRGRAYPMHPYLNHLGPDLCRGMLEFADGRLLGKCGLRWLKIHVANLYANGVDKLSFDGRVAFVEENVGNIIDSADSPLEGNRWWLNAENPFQCLAACFDLRDALRSEDTEKFVSHLPVHQDGSCNGLQHYAALGRDSVGAETVNLTKKDVPADVYSGIAFRVKEMMEVDALKDPAVYKTAASACKLIEQIDRKLVKQTVMTSVYGVTFIGARSQILSRLEERHRSSNKKENFILSSYAAKTTLTALGEIFNKARSIMLWLADCAKLIASQNKEVRWTTPLGLPVVQAYRKPGFRQVKTSLQVLSLRSDREQPVLVQRQKTAFPPNFVHSLDSTHMMMTAVACHKAGLCFAGVHDSFWTHAGDVGEMNSILRETFIKLYSQPILENLLNSFQEKFPEVDFPPLPKRGNFDLNEVRTATYFFN